jgi:hypothetical protein
VYERILGRPVSTAQVSPGEPVPGIPPPVLPLLAALDTYDTDFDASVSARAFGVTLTRFEDVARRQHAGAATATH